MGTNIKDGDNNKNNATVDAKAKSPIADAKPDLNLTAPVAEHLKKDFANQQN